MIRDDKQSRGGESSDVGMPASAAAQHLLPPIRRAEAGGYPLFWFGIGYTGKGP
jgi:hypothetical protein